MLGKCLSISHITFYVSNARQAAVNYCLQYGFRPFRYRGLENGCRLQTSHAVINNDIIFVFISPLIQCKENELINNHIVKHGDGVKDVAFNVSSIEALIKHIRQNNVQYVNEWHESDENGTVKFANLGVFGDTTHTLIERNGYPRDMFLPGWTPSPLQSSLRSSLWSQLAPTGLQFVDHVAANQSNGQMSEVVKWYENILGFHRFWSADDTIINTHLSGLKTTFMANHNELIKMPINESGPGAKRSQIQEFLDYNCGPGVQHIALHTYDICEAVSRLKDRGVEFLTTPDTYYHRLSERLKDANFVIKQEISRLHELNILVDFDRNGYLLQIFTKPVQDRPTLFLEIIERHNYNGFGAGNIKALFEAIETEQNLRGNL